MRSSSIALLFCFFVSAQAGTFLASSKQQPATKEAEASPPEQGHDDNDEVVEEMAEGHDDNEEVAEKEDEAPEDEVAEEKAEEEVAEEEEVETEEAPEEDEKDAQDDKAAEKKEKAAAEKTKKTVEKGEELLKQLHDAKKHKEGKTEKTVEKGEKLLKQLHEAKNAKEEAKKAALAKEEKAAKEKAAKEKAAKEKAAKELAEKEAKAEAAKEKAEKEAKEKAAKIQAETDKYLAKTPVDNFKQELVDQADPEFKKMSGGDECISMEDGRAVVEQSFQSGALDLDHQSAQSQAKRESVHELILKELGAFFEHLDKNNDGCLDEKEFKDGGEMEGITTEFKKSLGVNAKELEKVRVTKADFNFDAMDRNGDNKISANEAFHYVADSMPHADLSSVKLKKMFAEADQDGDQFISRKEFDEAGSRITGDGKNTLFFEQK